MTHDSISTSTGSIGSIADVGRSAALHALKRLRFKHAPDARNKWNNENTIQSYSGSNLIRAIHHVDPETATHLMEGGDFLPAFIIDDLFREQWSMFCCRVNIEVGPETNGKKIRRFTPIPAPDQPNTEICNVDLCVIGKPNDIHGKKEHINLLKTICFALEAVAYVKRETDGSSISSGRGREQPVNSIPITCILSRKKRILPQKDVPIGPEHVNAGVTFLNSGRIIVYRNQHVHKVLIHELIHFCRLDADLQLSKAQEHVESMLREELQYDSLASIGLRCYESYVETLACFWNMYRAKDRAGTGTWKQERRLFFDVSRIIWEHQQPDRQENTHVLAYYHGKAALWDKLSDLPIWPTKIDGSNITFWATLYEALRQRSPFWHEIQGLQAERTDHIQTTRNVHLSMTTFE